MSGFWLISFVVLWILVVSLALVILALAREIESLHTRLDSLTKFLGRTKYEASLRDSHWESLINKNQQID